MRGYTKMGKRPKKSAPKSRAGNGKTGFMDKVKDTKEKVFGKGKGKGKGGKRHKKSALWYAKEIQRLKLKKRFEKVKFGVMR